MRARGASQSKVGDARDASHNKANVCSAKVPTHDRISINVHFRTYMNQLTSVHTKIKDTSVHT